MSSGRPFSSTRTTGLPVASRCLQHLLLDSRQIHRCARCRFAAHVRGFTQHRDHKICVRSRCLRFRDQSRCLCGSVGGAIVFRPGDLVQKSTDKFARLRTGPPA